MIVEGKGLVAPSPLRWLLRNDEMVVIYLSLPDLSHYDQRTDAWGKGLKGDLVVPAVGKLPRHLRPIFVAKISEYALVECIKSFVGVNAVLDLQRRPHGDGGVDVVACGLRMQVKTRQKDNLPNLVKYSQRGQLLDLGGDCHVFCKWLNDCYVYLLGWIWNTDILNHPIATGRAPNADWENVEIPDEALLPMARLWAELKSRKGAA